MVAKEDEQIATILREGGWNVVTSGWPDVLAYKPPVVSDSGKIVTGGEVMAIEIKRGTDKLRPSQKEMQKVFLENLGVPYRIARDEDIANITRFQARVVAPWASLASIKGRVIDLMAAHDSQIAELRTRLTEFAEELDKITVLFKDIPAPERVDAEVYQPALIIEQLDSDIQHLSDPQMTHDDACAPCSKMETVYDWGWDWKGDGAPRYEPHSDLQDNIGQALERLLELRESYSEKKEEQEIATRTLLDQLEIPVPRCSDCSRKVEDCICSMACEFSYPRPPHIPYPPESRHSSRCRREVFTYHYGDRSQFVEDLQSIEDDWK